MSQGVDTSYNLVSNYYKSFSGTDTLVFVLMPGSNPVILGSLTTVSYSLYRTKQPVINLGRTNINGITRGVRIFAGTMIFTLINQHWLRELTETESLKWLSQFDELKADELPLFDLMIVSANEYGSYVSMFIYGVDITDESQVISVEDLYTENTLSFVARDLETFKAGSVTSPPVKHKSQEVSYIQFENFFVFNDSVLNNSKQTTREYKDVIKKYETELQNKLATKQGLTEEIIKEKNKLKDFTRDLQYSPINLMAGSDVFYIQDKLREYGYLDTANSLYDKDSENAVRLFQSDNGIDITGVVNNKTFIAIIQPSQDENRYPTGIVINKSGARIYSFPNIHSDIIDIIPYNNIIEIINKLEDKSFTNTVTKEEIEASGYLFYQIETGYALVNDIYSYIHDNKTYGFPVIQKFESGHNVTVLQDILSDKYGLSGYESGLYDQVTIDMITKIQTENNITCILGVVNEETWRWLQVKSGNLITDITNNNIQVYSNNPQGKYTLTSLDMETELFQGFNVTVKSILKTSVNACGVAYYNNESTKVISNQYTTSEQTKDVMIDFKDFQNLFTYTLDNGFPNKIEYIINTLDSKSYKWIIDYKGG